MYGGFASPKMDMNRRNVSSAIQERNRTCSLKSLTPFACTDTEKLPALWRACLFPHAQMPENYLRFGRLAYFRMHRRLKLPALWRVCQFPLVQMPEKYVRRSGFAACRMYRCRVPCRNKMPRQDTKVKSNVPLAPQDKRNVSLAQG